MSLARWRRTLLAQQGALSSVMAALLSVRILKPRRVGRDL